MNHTDKSYWNIYRVNESMTAPEWYAFAENAVDAGDILYWLNFDHGIEQDSDDTFYRSPASLYA